MYCEIPDKFLSWRSSGSILFVLQNSWHFRTVEEIKDLFHLYFNNSRHFWTGEEFQDLFYLYCKIPDILGRRRNSGSISFAIQIPDIFELEEFRICFILKQSCQFASYQSRQVQTCLKQSCQFVSYKTRQVQSQPWLAELGLAALGFGTFSDVLGRFEMYCITIS